MLAGVTPVFEPLSGIRVLDLSQYESGPLCAQFLAWYGADVVHVDDVAGEGEIKHSPLHFANNNNKRSIAVDLRSTAGSELVARLSADFDIVVENFAVGVTERLGLDYPSLRDRNPGLIYCSIKAFGLTGPRARYRSFDSIAQAAGGAMSINGEPDGPPTAVSFLFADNVTGTTAVSGVLAAYIQRLRTGAGQLVEVSMQEAILNVVRSKMLAGQTGDGPAARGGVIFPPQGLYPCQGGGPNDYVQITGPDDRLFRRLAEAIGRPELADDPRFSSLPARIGNGEALFDEIAAWTLGRTKWQVMESLAAADVPVSAVFDSDDISRDEHLRQRGAVTDLADGRWIAANPVRFEGASTPLRPAPALGQHTHEVLRELGVDDAEIQRLQSDRVIRQA